MKLLRHNLAASCGLLFLTAWEVAQAADPVLGVVLEPDQRLRLEWTAGNDLTLESTGALSTAWQPVAGVPTVTDGVARVWLLSEAGPRFYRLKRTVPTGIAGTSPIPGETGVAVTREAILRLSAPLASDVVLNSDAVFLEADGRRLLGRVELGNDRRSVTVFPLEPVPSNTRVRVTFDGTGLRDAGGVELDLDGDGVPGGRWRYSYRTAPVQGVPGTAVAGRVLASERNPDGSDRPLAGVTITVDGAEETLRTVTDTNGFFELNPSPVGRFFVHIDGRTAQGSAWPVGEYYPFVGKAWETVLGTTNRLPGGNGLVYLPRIPAEALQEVSPLVPTPVTFTAAVLAARPELAGVEIVVPPNALFSDSGNRGGRVGLAPVPPDRLPEPLPPGLDMPLVITIQTDGPQNFAEPVPVRFPNLPDPVTGRMLPPGAKTGLWSFNHDTGRWEPQGGMTVSADGRFVDSDPGVGVRQPGWHGSNPGNDGDGPDDEGDDGGDEDDEDDPDEEECPDRNRNFLCDDNEPRECRDKEFNAYFNASDCFSDITLNLATSQLGWAEACAMGGANGSWRVVRDCLVFDLGACESSAGAKAVDFSIGCIPKIGGWIGAFKCGVETITAWEDYWKCLNGPPSGSPRVGRANAAPGFNQIPEYLARAYRDLSDQIELTERAQAQLATVLGTTRWNELPLSEDPAAFDGLVQALQNAQSPTGGGGAVITPAEEAALLALPRPAFASAADVQALVTRLRQLQAGLDDPALDTALRTTTESVLQVAERLQGDGWVGVMDGGLRGLLTLAAGLEPEVGSQDFPARRHFYLLKDLETGFERRGRLEASGNFTPLILPPNRLHAVLYFDPVEDRFGATLFRSGDPGGSTRIPAARMIPDSRTDTDSDGLSDVVEWTLGTSPQRPDTDGDGRGDRLELADGSNPLDGIARPLGVAGQAELPISSVLLVAAEGNRLYASGAGVALGVFDLTEPTRPVRVGMLPLLGRELNRALAVQDGWVAVGGADGLVLIDARNGSAPVPVSDVGLANVVAAAWMDDVVLALAGSTLTVLEGRTGAVRRTVSLPEPGHDLQAVGDVLFVLTRDRLIAYRRIDAFLVEQGRVAVSGGASPLETGRKLFVGGGRAYVGTFQGFTVVDVRQPANLQVLGAPPSTQAAIHDLEANDAGLLLPVVSFSGTATLALGAYDVRDPSDVTRFLTSWNTPGDARALALHRGWAYVADTLGDVQVVNYLSPDLLGVAPTVAYTSTLVGSPPRTGWGERVRLQVDARDDVQVRDVEALVDDAVVAVDGNFPFELAFTAPSQASGRSQFTLRVRATDTAGNVRLTDPVVVLLGTTPSPPRMTEVFPSPDGRVDALGLGQVLVAFDQELDPASVLAGTLRVVGFGADRVFGTADDVERTGTVGLAADGRVLRWTSADPLPTGFHRVLLEAGIRGTNGAARSDPVAWSFEGVSTRPGLASTIPTGSRLMPSGGVTHVFARLNARFDPDRPQHPAFSLRYAGVDWQWGTADDREVPLAAVDLLASGIEYRLNLAAPLVGGVYRVILGGAGFTVSTQTFTLRPYPNEWVSPVSGNWSTAANWFAPGVQSGDFVRIPRLIDALVTTNNTTTSFARIESDADFVKPPGRMVLTGEGVFAGNSRWESAGSSTLEIQGGGTLVNLGHMQWFGGNSFANVGVELVDVSIVNRGRLEWVRGHWSINESSVRVINEPGGIFEVGAEATKVYAGISESGSLGQFINAGTVLKGAGTNSARMLPVPLQNDGRVVVTEGELQLGVVTGSGEFEVRTPGTLALVRSFRVTPDARIVGDGTVLVTGGSAENPQMWTHRHELTGTTRAVSGTVEFQRGLQIPGATFEARGGRFRFRSPVNVGRLATVDSNSGGLELAAAAVVDVLELGRGQLLGPGGVEVRRHLDWSEGRLERGDDVVVRGTGEIRGGGQLTERRLHVVPGAEVVAPVTASVQGIGTTDRNRTGRILNEGTFIKRGAGGLSVRVPFENRALLRVEEGRLLFERVPSGDGRLTLSGGELQLAGGELGLYLQTINNATLGLVDTVLSGHGRIVQMSSSFGSKVENRHRIRLNAPGKALEILTMGYEQTSAGELEVTLGAAGAPRLAVDPAYSARLGGRLRVILEPGHVPAVGERHELLSSGRSGEFGELVLPDLGSDRALTVTYPDGKVVLEVVAR